ncbi:MAG: hypothetical protein R3293_26290 [Candidatus Promineifilaceae bacterium]|nr:hypothetical protein [Candidatus Promineifilaceae bacterium]
MRTYYSLLRSSRPVQIKTLAEAHKRMRSALHVKANDVQPDMAAFIYSILRVPACINKIQLVVMGQSEKVFAQHGFPDIEQWELVAAPGRRRQSYFDGQGTLAVYIASRSDIDDLVPILTAYQIEQRKLHRLFNRQDVIDLLESCRRENGLLTEIELESLSELTKVPLDDLERLNQIWGDDAADHLLSLALNKQSISIMSLAGSLADYKRATHRWWKNVEQHVSQVEFSERPIYFVSSNTHSLANLLSGYALSIESRLQEYINSSDAYDLAREYHDIIESNVPSSLENFLYYVLKKYQAGCEESREEMLRFEQKLGISRVPSSHAFDIEVQVVSLNQLRPQNFDPRLQIPGIESIVDSDALLVNIDYPLGMAAYQVLTEIARNVADVRGVYVMGKAATLNGRIGDVMIPGVVHDEHSLNTYLFENCISANDVAPYLAYGTVMDNQKAITVPGTFLQNEGYMSVFYKEGYTDMEMEAGPFLSAVYEMFRPVRHPYNELVNLQHARFPIGIAHYASDTPFSKGKNLGARNLSYYGMDPTYATTIAILRAIFALEVESR